MNYRNKLILAPMVRTGTLPMRLLALSYGADLVYSEEIIDHKMLLCKRVDNALLDSVDFVTERGLVVFRTCAKERHSVIFQMGTACAERAVKVGQLIQNDVAGIDINMGCPKEFSIKGGMGAALLTQLDKVKEIVSSLVKAVSIPVTCKIRVLSTVEETMAVVETIQSAGGAAITVHGRTRDERPQHPNRSEMIAAVVRGASVPIIANGGSRDIRTHSDLTRFRDETGATSVMIARAAQINPSVFREDGLLPSEDVVRAYLKYAVDYNNTMANSKYCMQQFIKDDLESPRGKALLGADTTRELCDLWEMSSYYDSVQMSQTARKRAAHFDDEDEIKRRKLADGTEMFEASVRYNRRLFTKNLTPKMILYSHSRSNLLPVPKYDTEQEAGKERAFSSTLEFDGKRYLSTLSSGSKKCSEQAAAYICLRTLGLINKQKTGTMNDNCCTRLHCAAPSSGVTKKRDYPQNPKVAADNVATKDDCNGGVATEAPPGDQLISKSV